MCRAILVAGLVAMFPPTSAPAATVAFEAVEVAAAGGLLHPESPRFVEDGVHVEAFWAVQIGKPRGGFIKGHFHPPDLAAGFEGQHYGSTHELHGVYLRRVDGRPFSLRSLDYRVTQNRNQPGRNRSVKGFRSDDVQLLIATHFDPKQPLARQFLWFPVGVGGADDPERPFRRLSFVELESVTQLFIGSSASVDIDNIVIDP